MFEFHNMIHNSYGICLWTLLALVVAVIMAVIAIVHVHNQKVRDEKFHNDLDQSSEEMTEVN